MDAQETPCHAMACSLAGAAESEMNFSSFASWRSSSETRTTSSRSWVRVMATSSVLNGGRGPVGRHPVDWDHGAVQHQVLQTVGGGLAQRLAELGRVCSWQPQRPRWHTATRWRAETGDPATGPAQVSPLRRYTWVIKACGLRQAPDCAADGLTVPSDDPGSMAHSSARQRQRSAIQQRARPVVGAAGGERPTVLPGLLHFSGASRQPRSCCDQHTEICR